MLLNYAKPRRKLEILEKIYVVIAVSCKFQIYIGPRNI